MRGPIFITKVDLERLRRLVEGWRGVQSPDRQYLDTVQEELDRAEIVEPDAIPADVITMNSQVRLKDLDSGEEQMYRLVFPSQARTESAVSVLAPIGTAILGYRVGDVIEWPVPKGIRRLEVLDVVYQPEASGVIS